MTGMSLPFAGRTSIQFSGGCNFVSLLMLIGLDNVIASLFAQDGQTGLILKSQNLLFLF